MEERPFWRSCSKEGGAENGVERRAEPRAIKGGPHARLERSPGGPCSRLHLPSRSLSKGGVPSHPLPTRRAGDGGKSVLAQVQGIIPPKSGPHLFSPLTPGSDRTSPTPSAEKIGGKSRTPSEILLASLLAFSDGFRRGKVVVVVMVIVAWLALWRSWWWRLLAWRFVAMVVQNNER